MAKLLDIDKVVDEIEGVNIDNLDESRNGLEESSDGVDNFNNDLDKDNSDNDKIVSYKDNDDILTHHLEKIPRNVDVKKKFEDHYRELLGNDYDKFMNYSLSYIRKCIRVNTLKADVSEIKKRLDDRWQLDKIPWCPQGFWITYKDGKRFDIGNLIEHHLGYVYVQEAASMIPPIILDPKPGEMILDMCAAPGSKTTQIAMYMENKGILMANDVAGARLRALGMNMQRCGVSNAVITMMQEHKFQRIATQNPEFKFDRILVDAPCSGTGTIRKSLRTILMWNPLGITKLSKIQKNLIDVAFNLLKPNGVMVYSTCTIEPEENEVVVSYLLDKYPNAELEDIDNVALGINRTNSITKFQDLHIRPEVEKCLRIHPYDNDTEGFFVARIRKVS
ncbi:MAG: NOL1/NOP2/sun family putative RNA methylase [Candidatus Woesearchaeota archaeon]